MKALTVPLLVVVFTIFGLRLYAAEALTLQLESGAVWQHRNDVRIRPSTGTNIEFDKFNQGPFFHYRAEAFYEFNDKHGLRAVYAPFQVTVTGQLDKPIIFNDASFLANQDFDVNFKFNSYRLSYVYQIYKTSSSFLKIGITGKIRDAQIQLSQSSTKEAYDNVGFVPLFYVAYKNQFSSSWHIYSDMDFAAAPQGRAIDFSVKIRRDLNKASSLGLGLRTLEGGADNDKVFTFSWLNYAILDYLIRF